MIIQMLNVDFSHSDFAYYEYFYEQRLSLEPVNDCS